MDVWLKISTPEAWTKSLTLVVTPFKKFCGSQDLQYRQCRYSTKCVRYAPLIPNLKNSLIQGKFKYFTYKLNTKHISEFVSQI